MSTTLTGRIGGSSAIADPLTDLDALEALSGTGLAARTATNAWALRALAAPAAGIAVSNGDGSAGNATLALANDLAALEALAATGFPARTASDSWAQRTIAVSGAGLSVSNGDGVSGNPTVTIDPAAVVAAGGGAAAATQADQETATSLTTFVSPGRQHFHPSAAKCWAFVSVDGSGVPSLGASRNITSVTDGGVGILTITIATDFSSAAWAALPTVSRTSASGRVGVKCLNRRSVLGR
jgi:hypothetical protein